MIYFNCESAFEDNTIADYLNQVVKMRNTIAHKKLDVCRTQRYIRYCDNINQYKARACPKDCIEHTDSNKISVSQWTDIRKRVIEYGKCFDKIFGQILGCEKAVRSDVKEIL